MTGKELKELIDKNNWQDVEIWSSTKGIAKPIQNAEPLFPKLNNTNEVVLTDGNDVIQDNKFWINYYGRYMRIIPLDEADTAFKSGDRNFYILYCDGTEGKIDDNMSEKEWEQLKLQDVLFGLER